MRVFLKGQNRTSRDTEKALWSSRQRLKLCNYKPRNTKDGCEPSEPGRDKEEFFPSAFRESMHMPTL